MYNPPAYYCVKFPEIFIFFRNRLHPGNRKKTSKKYQRRPQPQTLCREGRKPAETILQSPVPTRCQAIPAQRAIHRRTPFQNTLLRQRIIPTHPHACHATHATVVHPKTPRGHVFQVRHQRPRRAIRRTMHCDIPPMGYKHDDSNARNSRKSRYHRGIDCRNIKQPQSRSHENKQHEYRPTDSGSRGRLDSLPFTALPRRQIVPNSKITQLAAPGSPGKQYRNQKQKRHKGHPAPVEHARRDQTRYREVQLPGHQKHAIRVNTQ